MYVCGWSACSMFSNDQAKNLNRACNELAELTLDALRSVVSITCGCMVKVASLSRNGRVWCCSRCSLRFWWSASTAIEVGKSKSLSRTSSASNRTRQPVVYQHKSLALAEARYDANNNGIVRQPCHIVYKKCIQLTKAKS